MQQYLVRFGDTLWSIAERFYGDGQHWSYLIEYNPLLRSGLLYEGQRLVVAPLPAHPWSRAEAHQVARTVRHAPVKVRFDRSMPIFRHESFNCFGFSGFSGELIFHRYGNVQVEEISATRLLQYRLSQVAWARSLFLKKYCGYLANDGPSSYDVDDYRDTTTGNLESWNTINHFGNQQNASGNVRVSFATDPSILFESATLLLGDVPLPPNSLPGKSISLGQVLRAACPNLISPASLWVFSRDDSFAQPALPFKPPAAIGNRQALPAPVAKQPKPRKAVVGKKPVKTRAQPVKARVKAVKSHSKPAKPVRRSKKRSK